MPIIITVHMAKSSATCCRSHDVVIIHAAGPVIVPYMSRAIGTIHSQQTAVTPRRMATGTTRATRAGSTGSMAEDCSVVRIIGRAGGELDGDDVLASQRSVL